MKTIDFLCASQASTAVDQPSSSPAGRAIDRHNPIIADGRRSNFTSKTIFPNPPCSSHYSPINPLPYHQLHAAADQIPSAASATHKPFNMKKKKRSSSIITTDFVRFVPSFNSILYIYINYHCFFFFFKSIYNLFTLINFFLE